MLNRKVIDRRKRCARPGEQLLRVPRVQGPARPPQEAGEGSALLFVIIACCKC